MIIINRHISIAIIAGREETAVGLTKQLRNLIGDYISFSPFSMEQWSNNTTKFDLVLVSTQTMFMHKGSLNINMDTEILYIRRTLLKDSWEKLLSLTPGKDILLINDNKDSAVESISLLYELGARHIKFIPAYPGMKNVPNVSEAVTPGEQNEITENVKSLINIKERVIDTSTIVDILSRFDLLNSELRKK